MTRIFLHVGDHKTGTSTIQSALSTRQRSEDANLKAVYYPTSGRKERMAHHNLFWAMTNDFRFEPDAGHWPDVRKDIEEVAPDTAILSSEAFESFNDLPRLRAMIDTHLAPLGPVKIILYVRPHFDRLRSAFSQKMKTGQITGSIEEFVEDAIARKTLVSFASRLERWRSAFGESLDIRLYSRDHLEQHDILRDFLLKAVGLEETVCDDVATYRSDKNVSPGLHTMSLIEPFTKALELDSRKEKRVVVERFVLSKLLDEFVTLYPADHKPVLSKAAAQKLAEAARTDAEELDRVEFASTPIFTMRLDQEVTKAPDDPADEISMTEREQQIHEAYRRVLIAATKRHIKHLKNKDKL